MADIPLESIATSEPFCFLVGPEKKKFYMHASLAAEVSLPFNAMINGSMVEAREGFAHLPEVDEATFMRFFHYAYRGDYEVADLKFSDSLSGGDQLYLMVCRKCYAAQVYCQCEWCNHCQTDPSDDDCSFKKAQLEFASYRHWDWKHDENPKKEMFMRQFLDEAYLTYDMVGMRADDQNPGRCWSDVFLAHAKVYVMADCWGISGLAELSKHKIHQILIVFDINKDTVDTITTLVDYVFGNTTDEGGYDRLRNVLSRYCTIHIKLLSGSEQFQKLLRERGDLSNAIIQHWLDV